MSEYDTSAAPSADPIKPDLTAKLNATAANLHTAEQRLAETRRSVAATTKVADATTKAVELRVAEIRRAADCSAAIRRAEIRRIERSTWELRAAVRRELRAGRRREDLAALRICELRTRGPHRRGAGRPACKGASRRSSARSGSSGDSSDGHHEVVALGGGA